MTLHDFCPLLFFADYYCLLLCISVYLYAHFCAKLLPLSTTLPGCPPLCTILRLAAQFSLPLWLSQHLLRGLAVSVQVTRDIDSVVIHLLPILVNMFFLNILWLILLPVLKLLHRRSTFFWIGNYPLKNWITFRKKGNSQIWTLSLWKKK